jgi:hypothetical protein
MAKGDPTISQTPPDPEVKRLLSDVAFNDALAKLEAEAKSAQVNLQRLDTPGFDPGQALEIHKHYHQRECKKAQLRIEIFKLPREIEQMKRGYELACTPGVRRQHKERCMRVEMNRAVGRSPETGLPEAPEVEAKRNLDSAMATLESKERHLREITIHDEEWKTLINATPAPRQLVTQAPPQSPQVIRRSWTPRKSKPAEIPTDYPPGAAGFVPCESVTSRGAALNQPKCEVISKEEALAQASAPGAGDWEEIEISFISDERVRIRRGKKFETRNYAEFGFEDGRTENPNQAWAILRRLAEKRGSIENELEAGLEWSKLEKRIQEIRSVLREHFGITSDPIPFREKRRIDDKSGYNARFKIFCAPSYRT